MKTEPKDDQIKKATSSISAGLRILRNLETNGTAAEQAARAAEREEVARILTPVIQAAEAALAEVRPLREQHGELLTRLLNLRGRVRLPGAEGGSSWYWIEQAEKLVNYGIAGWEQNVERAKNMLGRGEQAVVARETAKELKPAVDLPYGVRYHLTLVEDVMARVREAAGADFVAEVTGMTEPAPAQPTETERGAEQRAAADSRMWGAMFRVETRRPEKTDTDFNPLKA